MGIYAIMWQLNSLQPHPEEQEVRIIEKIKTLPHHHDPDLKHVWFVATSWRAERLQRYLYKQFEGPDRYLIVQVSYISGRTGYAGQWSKSLKEWMEQTRSLPTTYQFLDKKELQEEREEDSI